MAVFKYSGTVKEREDFAETGTVVASSPEEARRKVEGLDYRDVHIKKLTGIQALFKKLSPDIR